MSILTEWVSTLEATTYPWTDQYLHTPNGFDPLGVLCEMYRLTFSAQPIQDQPTWVLDPTGTFYIFTDPGATDGISTKLPESVQRWADLLEADPIMVLTDSNLDIGYPVYIPLNKIVDGLVLKIDNTGPPVFGVSQRLYSNTEIMALIAAFVASYNPD